MGVGLDYLDLSIRARSPGTAGVASPVLFTYNFLTSPSMPTGLSLSRATTGTRFNGSGVLVNEAINVARFDNSYNGTSWIASGLRYEDQRTNQMVASIVGSGWTTAGLSVSSGATGPDGAASQRITEGGGSSQVCWFINPSLGGSGGEASIYAKEKGVGSKRYITGSWGANNSYATFDVGAGTVTETGVGTVSAYTENVSNGWRRCVMTSADTSLSYSVFSLSNTATPSASGGDVFGRVTYTLDNTSGMDVYGPQAEFTTYVSSLIIAPSSATTRSADLLSAGGTLATQLAAGPSVWEMTDLATGVTSRTSYAAGTFTFPINKLYRSFGVYPAATNTAPYLTVGGPY